MQEQKPPRFENPYLRSEQTTRLVANIDKNVYDYIYSIHPTKGTWQTLAALLIQKLHHELTIRNINNVTQQELFEHFITNCQLTLPDERTVNHGGNDDRIPRESGGGALSKTKTPHVARGTKSRGVKDKAAKNG